MRNISDEIIQIYLLAMATSALIEIESFVSKFIFLNSCGCDSDLRFSNKNGNIRVEFHANLGNVNMNPSAQESFQRHVKPSIRRRRQRRKEARDLSQNSSSFESTNALSTIPTLSQATSMDDLNANVIVPEPTPLLKSLQDKNKSTSAELIETPNTTLPLSTPNRTSQSFNKVQNNEDETLQTPAVSQNDPENAQQTAQHLWNNSFQDAFESTRSDPTAQQQTVQRRFPRLRTFTEDEFKRMLGGYGMTS